MSWELLPFTRRTASSRLSRRIRLLFQSSPSIRFFSLLPLYACVPSLPLSVCVTRFPLHMHFLSFWCTAVSFPLCFRHRCGRQAPAAEHHTERKQAASRLISTAPLSSAPSHPQVPRLCHRRRTAVGAGRATRYWQRPARRVSENGKKTRD